MSHYASSLCFLKIKHHLVNDLQNALDSYRSPLASDEYHNRCLDTLYSMMNCQQPYYPEWFLGYSSYDSYMEEYSKDIESGFHQNDDGIYVVETTAAKLWHQQDSINSTVDKLTDGYIIIRKCEDAKYTVEMCKASIFSEKFTSIVKELLSNEGVKQNVLDFTNDMKQKIRFTPKCYREPLCVYGVVIEDDFYE